MAITQAAVYDSVNALDRTHEVYLVDALAHPQASREAAVAAAAHRALVAFYPAQAAVLDAKLMASLATIPDGKAEDDGVALGRSVADQILALRQNDGSGVVLPPYLGGTAPGQWRPTPPANAPGREPHWPDVTPFAMTSGDQFRPAAPPALDSAEYTAAFNEVKELGSATSATRTADQTAMAHFWNNAAAPGSPGHLNLMAQIVAEQQGNTLEENARLFAALNIAIADAVISCWDAKYEYSFWRPVTGIREAANDGNPDTAADAAWTPLISTPAHPSYTSGHSSVSGAAAAVLADFFGTDNISFTLPSQNPAPPRPLLHQLFPGGGGVGRQPALRRHPLELRQQRRPGPSATRWASTSWPTSCGPSSARPAAGVVNGELIVVGTDGGDLLNVVRAGAELVVWANGEQLGQFDVAVTGIVMDGRGGNDLILDFAPGGHRRRDLRRGRERPHHREAAATTASSARTAGTCSWATPATIVSMAAPATTSCSAASATTSCSAAWATTGSSAVPAWTSSTAAPATTACSRDRFKMTEKAAGGGLTPSKPPPARFALAVCVPGRRPQLSSSTISALPAPRPASR